MQFTINHLLPIRIWENLGDVLLLGEGNLSFANSLLRQSAFEITNLIATTFDGKRRLTEEARKNADKVNKMGGLVLYDVDATQLKNTFTRSYQFDTIIFQFPNVGSRQAKYGRNPNHIMIRKFLQSAKESLKLNGSVLITAVDSPHYDGVFQFEEAAEYAGYQEPESFPFDPEMFPDYNHVNTNDQVSALDDHEAFLTWEFQPQP